MARRHKQVHFVTKMEALQRRLTSYRTDGRSCRGVRTIVGLDRQYGSLLGSLNSGGGYGAGSTEGALQRKRGLDAQCGALSGSLADLLVEDLAALNVEVERLGGPVIEVIR